MMINYVLLLCSVLVSIAGFWYPLHPDEQVFLRIAHGIHNGKLPYLDYQDNKPPGIYYLYAMFLHIIPNDTIAIRSAALIANITSTLLLWNITRSSLLVYSLLILLPAYQGQFALTEVFMLPFLLAALRFFICKRYFFTGLLLGMAFLFKQSAILNFVIALFTTQQPIIVLLGYIIPPLISFSALSFAIPFFVMSYWVLGSILTAYPINPPLNTLMELPKLLAPLGIYIPALMYSISIRQSNILYRYSVWIIVALLPILLFRPYHHYWIQILPFILIASHFSLKTYQIHRLIISQLIIWSLILTFYPFV